MPGTNPPPEATMGPAAGVTVVVPAGGGASRWGGRDKTAASLAGRAVLVHVLESIVAGAGEADLRIIVVGPSGHPARAALQDRHQVSWVREDPPGGGPVAALAAALGQLSGNPAEIGLIAGDMPFAGTALPRLLEVQRGGAAACVARTADGREHYLLATFERSCLLKALDGLEISAGVSGAGAGRAMRSIVHAMAARAVPVSDLEALDLDTPEDLERAEAQLRTQP